MVSFACKTIEGQRGSILSFSGEPCARSAHLVKTVVEIIDIDEMTKDNLCVHKPSWIRTSLRYDNNFFRVRNILKENKVNTICESGACPNRAECWSRGEATFMILGKNCTRNCLFCNVESKGPEPIDDNEPKRIAHVVNRLELDYVTLTSVTRDDLPDGGGGYF